VHGDPGVVGVLDAFTVEQGARVVSKRNGMVTPAGSMRCVAGFQPFCWNSGDGVLKPSVADRVPKQ
jgi:hypothetical protein